MRKPNTISLIVSKNQQEANASETTNPKNFTNKKIVRFFIFTALLIFLAANKIYSQPITPASPSLNNLFNTGVTAGAGASLPVNTQDISWTCSSSLFPGPPAIVVSPPAGCFWGGTGIIPQWIAPNLGLCSGGPPSQYVCPSNNSYDFYYTITFTMPIGTPLYINWAMKASGWIEDIVVNNTLAYKTYGNPSSPNPPFHGNTGINFKYCQGWSTMSTTNTIMVHVMNSPTKPPFCPHTGLLIQNFTPQNNYPNIIGNPIVCAGSTSLFTVPTSTALGLPNPSAFTCTWTKPQNWTGGTQTYSYNAGISNNAASGILTANTYSIITIATHTFASCASTAAYSVTVVPPLTITPTSTSICQGSTLQLTANGASSYTWYAPPLSTNIGSPWPWVTVSPTVSTIYTVKGATSIGGCIYTKTLSVNVLQSPTVSLVPSSSVVCLGNPVSFVPSGATSYTYWPGPIFGATAQFTPVVPTTYTIIGKNINGCTNTKTVSIGVKPNPTVTAVVNPTIICPGSSATLSANGASTYFWPQTFATTSVTVVSPNVTTLYQVIGTSTNGCSKSATVQLVVMTSPTVVISPPMICAGMANTLTATGASNYNWTIGTGTNQVVFTNTPSVVITLTAATVYQVCGTGPSNNCASCVNGTLKLGNPIPLSAPNVTWCTNASNNATITVNSSLNAPINYTWTPGPLYGQTQTVVPTTNTYYMVNATSSFGCPNSAIVKVDIISDCCRSPTVGMISVPQGTTLSGLYISNSYVLEAPITLSGNTDFQNVEFLMKPGASITVPPGMTLNLDKAHLYACGINMWQGVIVLDGARITTTNTNHWRLNSLIEDAEIAIDLDQISVQNSGQGTPPIDLEGVIFNKNYIGIKISNSTPNLDSLALGITGCVFTSKTLTYTSNNAPLDWPNSDMWSWSVGLRTPQSPTTALQNPYSNASTNFPFSNLLYPHNNTYADIGIKIENMGDPNDLVSKPGVQFGITYVGGIYANFGFLNNFNLFLGIGTGIEVINSSLTTKCNVFAEMHGNYGIRHQITPNVLMNARLNLKSSDLEGGNQFWDCGTGVLASNVYNCWIEHALFRSTHLAQNANNPVHMWGDTGISINTNRFEITVRKSQFNNIKNGIVFTTPVSLQNYNTINASGTGVFAENITIEQNYFGPQVLSTTPNSGTPNLPVEYSSDAIQLITPNTNGWYLLTGIMPSGGMGLLSKANITSNKINRCYRGILVDGMAGVVTDISANNIEIENDYLFNGGGNNPAFGYGIAAKNTICNLSIEANTLQAQGSVNSPTVSLIYCDNNSFNNCPASNLVASPIVRCNSTKFSHFGFHFNGSNSSALWWDNNMCEEWAGLALTNNAIIGTQGSSIRPSDNVWDQSCAAWGFSGLAPNQTYCENSDPNQSFLWVRSSSPFNPTFNNWYNQGTFGPYINGPSTSIDFVTVSPPIATCFYAYSSTPNWRSAQTNTTTTGTQKSKFDNDLISIYPNPASSLLNIDNLSSNQKVTVSIIDLTGKILFWQSLNPNENLQLNVSEFAQGLYLIEIKNADETIIRKKFIKTNNF